MVLAIAGIAVLFMLTSGDKLVGLVGLALVISVLIGFLGSLSAMGLV